MESFTDSFEYGVTSHIETTCTVISQLLNTTSILSINYSMNYTTVYPMFEGIIEYPNQFFASQNMTVLTEQLAQRGFSPDLVAIELVMLDEGQIITAAPIEQPTLSPVTSTISPTRMITSSPTIDFGAPLIAAADGESLESEIVDESQDPDNSPPNTDLSSNNDESDNSEATRPIADVSVTFAPSPSPATISLPTNTKQNVSGKSGLGVGLGVGIFVAAVVCVGLMFTWMHFRKKQQASAAEVPATVAVIDKEVQEAPPGELSLPVMNSTGIDSPKSFSDEEYVDIDIETAQTDIEAGQTFCTIPDITQAPEQGNVVMPMLITDLDGSDTSSDNLGQSLNEDSDVFDSYKNNQLEELRDGVTSSVGDTEDMMSFALTQVLFDENDTIAEDVLNGAGNPSEIEANFLFETNDWLKKNQETLAVSGHDFFQDLLNKMVVIVRICIIHPLDAARIVYCCAAILGMKLLKQFPNDVLLVLGMRKTNDASQGRAYLVDAMKEFGQIDGAAIALDRGFGFVRFVRSESVDFALERFRTAEIDVQGVSVMISSLNMR